MNTIFSTEISAVSTGQSSMLTESKLNKMSCCDAQNGLFCYCLPFVNYHASIYIYIYILYQSHVGGKLGLVLGVLGLS